MRRVLFICTANVCRSPMAEAVFNALAEDKAVGYRARSAGVAALTDRPIASKANVVLEELGIHARMHRARQVDKAMLEEADLVLTMTPWHVEELHGLFGNLPREIYTLPEYVGSVPGERGIPDPYGYSITAYRASLRQLFGYIEPLVERLPD